MPLLRRRPIIEEGAFSWRLPSMILRFLVMETGILSRCQRWALVEEPPKETGGWPAGRKRPSSQITRGRVTKVRFRPAAQRPISGWNRRDHFDHIRSLKMWSDHLQMRTYAIKCVDLRSRRTVAKLL